MNHDGNYKQIFSHADIVSELLLEFVNQEWVKELDLKSLEKVNGSYVSEELLQREDDIIWRVKLKDEWLYIYLLIEFQSTSQAFCSRGIVVNICITFKGFGYASQRYNESIVM